MNLTMKVRRYHHWKVSSQFFREQKEDVKSIVLSDSEAPIIPLGEYAECYDKI